MDRTAFPGNFFTSAHPLPVIRCSYLYERSHVLLLTTETFRKAARDPAEFGSYYLSHYFTRRSPPFHRQLSALWRRRVMKNRDPSRTAPPC